MGFCNGSVCLANEVDCAYSRHVYLLNPFLRMFKMLKFEFSCYYDWTKKNFLFLAFGFGKQDNDFSDWLHAVC